MTSLRVPTIGGRNINAKREKPAARPDAEDSQYNCVLEKLNPIWLSCGAMADTKYHVEKPMNNEYVVMTRVRHAILESQASGSSGSSQLGLDQKY